MNLLFKSVFLTILQIFNPEVTLISDQVLINVGAYNPYKISLLITTFLVKFSISLYLKKLNTIQAKYQYLEESL